MPCGVWAQGLSPAAYQLVRPALVPTSIQEACVRATHFQEATHIPGVSPPRDDGAAAPDARNVLPPGLSQVHISVCASIMHRRT